MRQLPSPQGNYFEDFELGQVFQHGVPRTITNADASLYLALTGSRFALNCADTVSQSCGFNQTPLDNLLVFHIAFGKTVNDISLNAIANLGYAEVNFKQACFPGDTVSVNSEVIGLKQNSNGKSGVVYVRSRAVNQHQQLLISWIRWVMVANKNEVATAKQSVIPQFEKITPCEQLSIPEEYDFSNWQSQWSDQQIRFNDIQSGDEIFHLDGITLNHSEHSLATRLYQNNAKVHFNQQAMQSTPHQQRLVYGGHIISLCRALSYNGLSNVIWPLAINAGTHANPSFAGDTIYAISHVLDKQSLVNRQDVGLVRIRLIGLKNNQPGNMEYLWRQDQGRTIYHPDLVLDLDYWALMLK